MSKPLHTICLHCEHRSPPPYSGTMLCTLDGADILDNEAARHCPAGEFNLAPWCGERVTRRPAAEGETIGAICWPDGTCANGTAQEAEETGGTFQGVGTRCSE